MTERQRRPHYQERRAHADGWDIEVWNTISKMWRPCEVPYFVTSCKYRIVPDADGWLPWYAHEGAVCPVPEGVAYEVRHRNGIISDSACKLWWDTKSHVNTHIVAYHIIEEVKIEDERIQAWEAVCKALDEVAPGWIRQSGTGIECAVAAIKKLAEKPAPKQGAWRFPDAPVRALNDINLRECIYRGKVGDAYLYRDHVKYVPIDIWEDGLPIVGSWGKGVPVTEPLVSEEVLENARFTLESCRPTSIYGSVAKALLDLNEAMQKLQDK